MAYQVIALKYRPQRFRDVVGQEHVTQTLSRAIEQKRIAHAYLFCGPRGTGKTTIARIFAKCLNCLDGPKIDFADDDPRCQEIAEGRSLDVLEIDAASNRGIDEIRGLRETVKYAPAASKFKVYIIDEVHMLTKEAFNALLKTLEEPPAHVKFMFATTEPERILPTILSRCQRFDLRRIPAALIVKHLAEISKNESVQIDQEALYAIARGAEGCMRDAESTLDQLISFCGEKIEEPDVLTMFGLTAHGQLIQLSRAILAGEVETTLRQLNELATHGKDLARLLSDLLNHFRNLLIFRVSKGDLTMLEVPESEAALLKDQSEMTSSAGLTQILEVLGDAEIRLREAASKKILVEVALLKAIEARQAVSVDALLQKLSSLRQIGDGTDTTDSAPAPAPALAPQKSTPTVAVPPTPKPGSADINSRVELREQLPASPAPAPQTIQGEPVEALWSALVEAVGKESPFARTYLLEAHPVAMTATLFTIGFPPQLEDHIALVDNPRNQKLLQAKLTELGHPNLQVKFIKAEPLPGRKPTAAAEMPKPVRTAPSFPAPAAEKPAKTSIVPSALSKEDFKNDPLIQKALEIFKGQIVEVRS